MNSKFFRFVEYAWLVIALVACVIAAYEINRHGFKEGKIYLIIPAVAFLWYGFRRSFRKRVERQQNKEE